MKNYTIKSKIQNCIIKKSEGITTDLSNTKYLVKWNVLNDNEKLSFTKTQKNDFLNYIGNKTDFISAIEIEDDSIEDIEDAYDIYSENEDLPNMFFLKEVDKFSDYNLKFEVVGYINLNFDVLS